ncbi:hypothetical protein EIKCOROL_01923 [Eikenella corrodens ATCC 23834]|uniref:Uncharacterized protein n=1 Tax=Eikenella corrodens ATCC 23834 TaxID=546274 RepID=C0DX20_EIKCO|nr:hypothetical protein EIKCOROL_01923 [Eikenella corrodens ATCC 23834]
MVIAAKQGQSGGERAEGGAGVAEEQIGLPLRETAAAAVHGVAAAAMMFDADAEALQRSKHMAGVVGIEQVFNAAGVVGQGGQQQGAVADAFGAGQRDGGGAQVGGGEVEGIGHDGMGLG